MTKFFRHENGWVNANDVIAIYDVYRKGGSETSKLRTRDDGFLKSNSSGVKLIDNLLPYVPASPQVLRPVLVSAETSTRPVSAASLSSPGGLAAKCTAWSRSAWMVATGRAAHPQP